MACFEGEASLRADYDEDVVVCNVLKYCWIYPGVVGNLCIISEGNSDIFFRRGIF